MEARVDYLVENYRSSRHIVDAANALIAAHRERMKTDHPIRINHARQNEAAGGRWHRLDRLVQGRFGPARKTERGGEFRPVGDLRGEFPGFRRSAEHEDAMRHG